MTNHPRFLRSHRRNAWSLVLTTRWRDRHAAGRAGATWTVEIDLEPVDGWTRCTAEAARRTVELNLRRHRLAGDDRDVAAHALPDDVRAELDARLGNDLAAWLLDPSTEILGIVNWAKHARFDDGGAPLRRSAWGQHAHLVPDAAPPTGALDLAA